MQSLVNASNLADSDAITFFMLAVIAMITGQKKIEDESGSELTK